MGQIVFQATLGGQVAVAGPNTASSFTLTLPAATDTLVGKATTDTLTNKTLTSPTITGATLTTSAFNGTVGATTASTGAFTTINASTSITNAALTSGRVTYAGASGLLTDSANLKFDGNNLGIGTTPAYDLQVSKTVSSGSVITQINNPSATGSARLYLGNDAGESSAYFQVFGSSHAAKPSIINIGGNANYPLVFDTNGTEKVRITAAGNVGIGTSSPGYQLDIASSDTSAGFGYAMRLRTNTTAGATSIQFTDNPVTTQLGAFGMDTSSNMKFWTGNTQKMELTASGNLGLGVTPQTWSSGKAIQINTDGALYAFGQQTELATNVYFNSGFKYISNGAATRYSSTSGQHQWFNAASGTAGNAISFTQAMTLDASGNLGVGTTTPYSASGQTSVSISGSDVSRIDFYNGATQVSNIDCYSGGGTGLTLRNITSLPMLFNTNNTERMRIDSSGNVLVNSSTLPTALNTNFKNIYVKGASNGVVVASSSDGLCNVTLYSGANSGDNPAIAFQNSLRFATTTDVGIGGFSERMRIDTSGNLLVGTTSAVANSKSSILFDGTAVNGLGIKSSTAGSNAAVFVTFKNSADSTAGLIQQNGLTTVAYTTSSDYRLKEKIVPMTGALATVAQLKPVTYKWKADGSDGQGFIAHELQSVVPDCVTGEKDAIDEDGKPKYQAMDTSFLIATLTAAIQEQQALIESLTTRLIALESK